MGRPSKYSPEFRGQAGKLVRATGKTVAEVAPRDHYRVVLITARRQILVAVDI